MATDVLPLERGHVVKTRILPPYRPGIKKLSDIPFGSIFVSPSLPELYVKIESNGSGLMCSRLAVLCLFDGKITALPCDLPVCIPEKIVVTQ